MKINHHNYEEYFILYIDNELDQSDRRMVEAFIQQHPDLKGELDILMQFKLVPDNDIVFEGKEELMMGISISNADEESLLNYIDNELTDSDKQIFEKRLSENETLRKELNVFRHTKLEKEQIVFKHKSSLYRDEKIYRPFINWRIAAAILLLIGLGVASIFILNNNSKKDPDIVKINPDNKTTSPVIPKQSPLPVELIKEEIIDKSQEPETKQQVMALDSRKHPVIREDKKTDDQENKPDIIAANTVDNRPSNYLPDASANPNIRKPDAAIVKIDKPVNNDALTKPVVTRETPQPYIIQTSFPESEEMEQPDSKKNKLRGFFRKVARTFEKRTNIETTDNDNKLLVAGLAINLK
jgi:hypothetical protein